MFTSYSCPSLKSYKRGAKDTKSTTDKAMAKEKKGSKQIKVDKTQNRKKRLSKMNLAKTRRSFQVPQKGGTRRVALVVTKPINSLIL